MASRPGAGQPIASGALWFYWRLGFRPVDRALRSLAVREWRRLQAGTGRRTPPALLRRLSTADLQLVLPDAMAAFDERLLQGASHAVTVQLAERAADGHRRRAVLEMRHAVAHVLAVWGERGWSAAERRSFEQLAPVVWVVLDDVAGWPARDRRALLAMMRAKGSPQELSYVKAMQGVPRFWAALAKRARTR